MTEASATSGTPSRTGPGPPPRPPGPAFKGGRPSRIWITSMLRDLARLAVQRNVMEPLFGHLAGAISSGFGGSTGTTATTGGTAGGGLNWGEASMQAPKGRTDLHRREREPGQG